MVSQLDTGGIGYNIPWALEIAGELDVERVGDLNELAARHESFRHSFAMQEDQLMQRISRSGEVCTLEATDS
ncbi:condensation domain-containing protein [Paenibacillus rhizoplanae]